MSDRMDFHKHKLIRKDKEGHFILIKELIHKGDIKILDIYALNLGAHNFTKQILLCVKQQTNPKTLLVATSAPYCYQRTGYPEKKEQRNKIAK